MCCCRLLFAKENAMEEKNMNIVKGLDGLPPPAHLAVAVALSGSTKSKHVLKWALGKFVPEGRVYFKLLHVHPVISRIPTPMGNLLPVSQVREDVVAAYRKEVKSQVTEKLLLYKKMCSNKKALAEIVLIESDDMVAAITGEISKNRISKLVIGASSWKVFSRARTLSSKISESCPTFCTVYAVSKGKLSSLRPSDSETNVNFTDDSISVTSSSTEGSSRHTLSSQTEWTDQISTGSFSHSRSDSLPFQRFQALSTINQILLHKRAPSSSLMLSKSLYLNVTEESNGEQVFHSGSNVNDASSQFSSFSSSITDNPSWDRASNSDNSSQNQLNVNFELEKLRIELRHVQRMYAMAQGEVTDTSRKLTELQKCQLEEEINLKQIRYKEEEAKELARQEKERHEAARREAEFLKECAEREAAERKQAEIRATREAKEKENLESALAGCSSKYRKFTWDEIMCATSSLSDDLKIGMGAYGTVYKCTFHHTTAAVKVLHAKESRRIDQFQQELEILSQIRHPHLLILLGACPDHGCLVYEFMENGCLEDRLMRKYNTPPLLWFDRYRIAWEVALALIFLHNSKPNAIIHRDLKPANILLDRNYVSKIGDIGLSTMVNNDPLALSTIYKDTAPVGTLCYIDPEYQRTGVVSPKSDVYAFGIVILQLLTAKPATALAHIVEIAVEDDRFLEVLDTAAGSWPVEETKELAVMALKCTELRQRDRPDLQGQVLPVLEKLKDFAEKARNVPLLSARSPPHGFICPLIKEVMTEPYVAADGYTYDRKAIQAWLDEEDVSPMTNLPLAHKRLVPDNALRYAIIEWKKGM